MHKYTLLYVEDDESLREQFVRVLKPKFKMIYEAKHGLEALELYTQHKPHMLIIDINLPKLNGLAVVEKIRETDTQIPIVVLSAYSDQEKLFKAVRLGLTDYLVKPVPYKKLLAVVEKMCQRCSEDDTQTIPLSNSYIWQKEEKRLYFEGENISLTKREILFLELLITQANKIVTYENIEHDIWRNDYTKDTRSALSHLIKRLRKKLAEPLFENIYGEGYRIFQH
ncbi:MAG TPA: response regulator transcription factor [Sulfurovum sp.]|nr:response regulator transcription factor [Sulfurovum sp.]